MPWGGRATRACPQLPPAALRIPLIHLCFIALRLSDIWSTISVHKHPYTPSMSPDTALPVRTRRDLILATNNRVGSQGDRPKPARQPRAECVTGYSDSPLAVSPTTGRIASGPWQGPYGSSMGSAGSSPIYLDSKGSGHFSLETTGPESPTTPVASMSM